MSWFIAGRRRSYRLKKNSRSGRGRRAIRRLRLINRLATAMAHIQRGARSNMRFRVPGSAANRQTVTAAFSASHNATPVQTMVIVMMPPPRNSEAGCALICLNP